MIRPLLAYGRWQLRDHLRGVGLVIALFGAAMALLFWRIRTANPGLAEGAEMAFAATLRQLGWPLVVLTVSGIVSTDRVEGYNRVLFSAPVTPAWFYLQRFVLGGLVFGTLPLVLALTIRASLGVWVAPWAALFGALLLYALLGGLVFCWSTFGRRDWAIGLAIYLGQGALHAAREAAFPLPRWLLGIEPLLPPFHLLSFGGLEGRELVSLTLPAGVELLHYLGYAAALVAIGCVVLHARPMGGGGRG